MFIGEQMGEYIHDHMHWENGELVDDEPFTPAFNPDEAPGGKLPMMVNEILKGRDEQE